MQPHRTANYWDDIAAEWADGRHQLWRQVSDAINQAMLDAWLPSRSECLLKTDAFDEAVSRGVYEKLAERAATVVAIDVSPPLLAVSSRKCPGMKAAASDVRRLPFSSASFDTVVSLSTLDHFGTLADIEASVADLRRVTRPGGCLILTLDNPVNPLIRLRNSLPYAWLNRTGLVPYYVGVAPTPRQLTSTLASHGFRVTDSDALVHVPRVAAVALARLVTRLESPRLAASFVRGALSCERLSSWPTRYLSGHFMAVRAVAE